VAKSAEVVELEKKLDAVLAKLLAEVGGGRSTLRIDDAAREWEVNFVCAEALTPAAESMRGNGSINQRASATVAWMEQHRKNLIQPDLTDNPDPAPPPALMSAYKATGQMLGPLFGKDGYLHGWISVHYLSKPSPISDADSAAMDRAREEVKRLTGIGS
jgi:hypothetical protein